MTLSTGTKLSHYEITSQLGKCGMGEVYRAKDKKLGRDVSIKVLHEVFDKDADRVARFQREAKLRSSSKHPYIPGISNPIKKTMFPKLSVLFLIVFILIGSTAFSEWWDEKSYTEWSAEQVDKILNDSPWAALSPAAAPVEPGYYNDAYVPLYYQIRLLTARPIREGMLRLISLGMYRSTVDVSELNQGDVAVEKNRRHLQEFLQSHPNDVRVKGDEQRIILAVTLKKAIWGPSPFITTRTPRYFQEMTNADSLSKIDPSKIKADTSLAANNGKRVALLSYVPPGPDQLGVKFYFPRYLPNGEPLIKAGTKELLFKTRINNTKIMVKFDLRKMLYKGKVEI